LFITDALGTTEPAKTSEATSAVVNVNDLTTGIVTITGTVKENEILTADTSALADEDGMGTFTYQWKADDTNIDSATDSTYTLTQAEVGKIITVEVIHTDAFLNIEPTIISGATNAVENENDAPEIIDSTDVTVYRGQSASGSVTATRCG
jgi:hypothetical protein